MVTPLQGLAVRRILQHKDAQKYLPATLAIRSLHCSTHGRRDEADGFNGCAAVLLLHLLALLLATIVNVVVNVSVVCTIAATAAVGVVVPVLFSCSRQTGWT